MTTRGAMGNSVAFLSHAWHDAKTRRRRIGGAEYEPVPTQEASGDGAAADVRKEVECVKHKEGHVHASRVTGA